MKIDVRRLFMSRFNKAQMLTIYDADVTRYDLHFTDRESLDAACDIIGSFIIENDRLAKELKYKDELLQTVLEDLDDACNEVADLQGLNV